MLGLLAIALCVLMLGAAFTLAYCQRELTALAQRARTRLAPPPLGPAGPPIEVTARSLRRLRGLVRHPVPGTPAARRTGTLAAYDDLLSQACRSLGIPDSLAGLPPGTERDAERLRVEHLLGEVGLHIAD